MGFAIFERLSSPRTRLGIEGDTQEQSERERVKERGRFDFFAWILIAAAVVLSYGATLGHEFVFDDRPRIEFNPRIQVDTLGPQEIREIVTGSGNRPVAYLTLAANHVVGGLDPSGYRLTNILIHTANSLLVYAIAQALLSLGLRRTSRSASATEDVPTAEIRLAALFAALFFALHPVQTQAVTYVIQRVTSLSVLFSLLAFRLFLQGRERAGRSRMIIWIAAFVSWALASATKEIAFCLPALVLLTEWFFYRDLDGRFVRRLLPWLVAGGLLLFVVGLVYLGGEFALPGYARRDFSMGERLLTQPRVVLFYLSLVLFPHPNRLSLHQVFETSHSLLDPPSTLLALVAIGLLLVLGVWLARGQRIVSFAIAWLFITLAIESTFLPLEMAFEHRLYFPLAGLSIMVGRVLIRRDGRWQVHRLALAGIVLATLLVATIERNQAWETRERLWTDVVTKNPKDARGHRNLGMALVRAERSEAAIPHFETAIRLDPDYYRAHFGMGHALAELGRHAHAIPFFERALEIDAANAEDWIVRTNLGASLHWLGRLEEAEARYREVLARRPEDVIARFYLASVLEQSGRVGEALALYEAILAIHPTHEPALAGRARMRAQGEREQR